jgi:site-specific DNA-cytosine methylase
MCANHNPYKVEIHEANHPNAEHWIADLVDPEAADYHSARDLPKSDILVAGISCTSHTQANTEKAYTQQVSLFDLHDEEYEARVTRSERDRATALCVLAYADQHHPRLILVECTTEFTSWGLALPNRPKVGDGSTYRWWRQQLKNLKYRGRVLYLNSMHFGVPQSRDRIYIVLWDENLPSPDLDYSPMSWCSPCGEVLPAVWTWKTGIPPTGSVRYGKQYIYTCPRCHREVIPPAAPALNALDLSNLGTRIGDKPLRTFKNGFVGPLAEATMARAERCRQRFPDFPAVIMPAKATHGVERHPWQPLSTQTSQQEAALLSTGALMVAAGNTYERDGSNCRSRDLSEPLWTQPATNTTGLITPPIAVTGHVIAAHRHNGNGQHVSRPMDTVTATHEKAVVLGVTNFQGSARGANESLPTQVGSETIGLLSAGIMPYRQNTLPTMADESMPTVTSDQTPALLTAVGTIKNNGSIDEAQYRAHPVDKPLGTLVASSASQGLLFSGWSEAEQPESNTVADQWRAALADLSLEDCYFRMLGPHEVGRGCGFDVDFPGQAGRFKVWGSARDQVDGFGNAVSPAVGEWIGRRLRAVLDRA